MKQQLERLATHIDIQWQLINWLHPRCKNTEFWPHYEQATQRFVQSQGMDLKLIGCLMRDTPSNEADLAGRGRKVGEELDCATDLRAYYLPLKMEQWPTLIEREGGEST